MFRNSDPSIQKEIAVICGLTVGVTTGLGTGIIADFYAVANFLPVMVGGYLAMVGGFFTGWALWPEQNNQSKESLQDSPPPEQESVQIYTLSDYHP